MRTNYLEKALPVFSSLIIFSVILFAPASFAVPRQDPMTGMVYDDGMPASTQYGMPATTQYGMPGSMAPAMGMGGSMPFTTTPGVSSADDIALRQNIQALEAEAARDGILTSSSGVAPTGFAPSGSPTIMTDGSIPLTSTGSYPMGSETGYPVGATDPSLGLSTTTMTSVAPSSPYQGPGSMPAATANDRFITINDKKTIPANNDPDFNDSCWQLEEAFNCCDFTRIPAGAEADLSPTALAINAVKAIKVIMNSISTSWDAVQKALAEVAVSEDEATQKTSNQIRWKNTAYMLAAAANNKSFRTQLATNTLKDSAPFFWKAFGKVFSVQPVSRRLKDVTGKFIEVEDEQRIIEALFRATQLLTKAKDSVGVIEKDEQADFVQGTRMFTSIIIQPTFAYGSIGLQLFAYRIFNEGILKWIRSLGPIVNRRDELWIVAAEAFNVLYSGFIGTGMNTARQIDGVMRGNCLGTDHIVFQFGKGSMAANLKGTYLVDYDKNLKAIADFFTKKQTTVGNLSGLVCKNLSDLLVLMMCGEACEYSMNETQAPSGADLIQYFYEKGFSFNNKYVNWKDVTSSVACMTMVTLDRLAQRTATTLRVKLPTANGYSSPTGGYTDDDVYLALNKAFVTMIAATSQFPDVGLKLKPIISLLQKDKKLIYNFMGREETLKNLRSFTPKFETVRISMALLPQRTTVFIPGGSYVIPAPRFQSSAVGYPTTSPYGQSSLAPSYNPSVQSFGPPTGMTYAPQTGVSYASPHPHYSTARTPYPMAATPLQYPVRAPSGYATGYAAGYQPPRPQQQRYVRIN